MTNKKLKTCTYQNPAPKITNPNEVWEHPEAECVYDGDDYERFKCPICGLYFNVTIPE